MFWRRVPDRRARNGARLFGAWSAFSPPRRSAMCPGDLRDPRSCMFPKPKPLLKPNTYAFESEPMVKPTGFREYDARWLLDREINLMGVQALGMGLGTLIRELGTRPDIVTG